MIFPRKPDLIVSATDKGAVSSLPFMNIMRLLWLLNTSLTLTPGYLPPSSTLDTHRFDHHMPRVLLALLVALEVFWPKKSATTGLTAEASGLDGCVVAGMVSAFESDLMAAG